MRRPRRTILATFHAMLAVQTIGSIDGTHKLPAPRQYVAHTVVWSILFLLADTGLGRLAARLSVLILLTASIVGPFGAKAVGFLSMIAQRFAVVSPQDATQPQTDSPLGKPPTFA